MKNLCKSAKNLRVFDDTESNFAFVFCCNNRIQGLYFELMSVCFHANAGFVLVIENKFLFLFNFFSFAKALLWFFLQ